MPSKLTIRLGFTLGACLVLFGFSLIATKADQAGPLRAIDASSLKIRDANGVVRAEIMVSRTNAVILSLTDPQGKERLQLGVTNDGTSVVILKDGAGEHRIQQSVTGDEGAGMTFYDERGRSRIAVSARPDGVAGVSLIDRREKVRAEYRIDEKEIVEQVLNDGNETMRLFSRVAGNGQAFVNGR